MNFLGALNWTCISNLALKHCSEVGGFKLDKKLKTLGRIFSLKLALNWTGDSEDRYKLDLKSSGEEFLLKLGTLNWTKNYKSRTNFSEFGN